MRLIYAVEDDKEYSGDRDVCLKNSGYQVDGFECARDFYKKLDERQPRSGPFRISCCRTRMALRSSESSGDVPRPRSSR